MRIKSVCLFVCLSVCLLCVYLCVVFYSCWFVFFSLSFTSTKFVCSFNVHFIHWALLSWSLYMKLILLYFTCVPLTNIPNSICCAPRNVDSIWHVGFLFAMSSTKCFIFRYSAPSRALSKGGCYLLNTYRIYYYYSVQQRSWFGYRLRKKDKINRNYR